MKKTNLSEHNAAEVPSGKGFRIGIVAAEWNSEITHALAQGALETLRQYDVKEDNIKLYHVPGSFELTTAADLMLTNLRWALANHPDVLPRTPVIPGFNDTPDDARAMARWLRAHGGTRVQLLPFHNFGESKYAFLDKPYALHGVKNLRPENLASYRQVYLDEGIEAFF